MILFNDPQTLVRLGAYDGKLEDAVKKYHEKSERGKSVFGNTIQFFVFSTSEKFPYLMVVSQQKDKILNSVTGHNTALTVTSYSSDTNEEVARSFQKETGIDLSLKVPDGLRKQYEFFNICFKFFEQDPEAAAAALSGRI